MPLVTETIEKLFRNKRIPLHPEAFIHSNQGAHYTSPKFQNLLKKKGLGQSMSRREIVGIMPPKNHSLGILKMKPYLKNART